MNFIFLIVLSFSAFADLTLNDAFKREKTYLVSQKDALLKMKSSLQSSLAVRKTKALADITQKQNELSRMQLSNQELHEEYKSLEKMTKESSQMSGQLDKNFLKVSENIQTIKGKLGLPHVTTKETDTVKKFEFLLQDVSTLIKTVSSLDWRKHAFLDENDHLVHGEVLFQGLFSAWGRHGSKIYTLSPYNKEFLKVVSTVNDGEIYLFTPDFERTNFKVSKTWKESVADAIPGVVMVIIMIAVLGLFIMLARA